MSETIGELILPGTYIEVRSEGLIGVGGISTGNIGVVGTANRGPLGTPQILGSYLEALDTFGDPDRFVAAPIEGAAPSLTLTRTLEQVFTGGGSTVYAVRVANADVQTMSWTMSNAEVAALLRLEATSPGTWANAITVTLTAPSEGDVTLDVVFRRVKETFTAANAGALAAAVNSGSGLVVARGLEVANRGARPNAVAAATAAAVGGPDGAAAQTTQIAAGLAALASQPVNIVVVGGFGANAIAATVIAHLEATENDGRERLAVLGASSDAPADVVTNDASAVTNPRVILVAPGIRAADPARSAESDPTVRLPASYAAALVAGRLSTVAPHISLTNKDVAASSLARDYSRAEQKSLLTNRVLVLRKQFGIRVLKAITTDDGAFRQISVRRIVDAKSGVRIGSNPYIGRLNNSRVRAALKATLDGFLSGMVLDEMLISYELDVTATRAQEINGIAQVSMTLRPTFSIDFVKVIMNLE